MSQSEPRIVVETGLAARVAAIVEPIIEQMGFRLVRVRVTGHNGCTVQIMAERPDGSFTVDDCEDLSHAVSPAIDVEDPIDRAYHLEISSPGIDRPLVRRADFDRWAGHEAKIELTSMVDGRKRYRGLIRGVDGDAIRLEVTAETGNPATTSLPINTVAEARLVMNDALVKETLRAEKAKQKEQLDQNGDVHHGH